ncbi:hypothetical protein C8R43DRAFT_79843 [Mycena crocata]|nr:hypothetical protein C8R43DRAFT_79843 [Mycena crocata]
MHDFSEDDDSSVESNWADADSDAAELVDPVTMATACPESDLPTLLTTKQQNELETLAKDVAELEDIYSITTKDHTSKTSVLTADESLRFRRAMYRITLYTKLFSLKQYTLDEIENLSVGTRRTVRQQRTAVLNEYPTNELLEIVSVVNFLRGIFNAVADPDLVDMLLATGPRGALQTWKSRSYYGLQDDYDPDLFFTADVEIPFYARYFTRAFDAIWGARDVEPPRRHDGADKWILDTVTGKDDKCSQCDDPRGLKLFTQANWSRFPVTSPLDHLKNQLRDNPTVSGPFARMWHKNDRSLSDSDDLGTWIAGLFEMRVAARAVGTGTKMSTNGVSTSTSTASTLALAPKTLATLKHGSFATFDGWDAGLSYCWPCLHLFIQAHAWVWWLEEQLKLGWTPAEDCRYGYNCKTQRREKHAQSENHLCVPSMVNPYGVRGHKS